MTRISVLFCDNTVASQCAGLRADVCRASTRPALAVMQEPVAADVSGQGAAAICFICLLRFLFEMLERAESSLVHLGSGRYTIMSNEQLMAIRRGTMEVKVRACPLRWSRWPGQSAS